MKKSLIAIALISVPSIAMANWGSTNLGSSATVFDADRNATSSTTFEVTATVPKKCAFTPIGEVSFETLGSTTAAEATSFDFWCNNPNRKAKVKFDHGKLSSSRSNHDIAYSVMLEGDLPSIAPAKHGGPDRDYVAVKVGSGDTVAQNTILVVPDAKGWEDAGLYSDTVTVNFKIF
ncbi:hypothetical protein [Vibrio agarivorans]|uniref:hypothetical protein n=1 Tax=Vibrio agarivorans TaxID=153622 RepID=UPI0025B3D603|nr:hypothetical protein [Vibrio agarivorans]MDN3661815.1 hypothetical protein [Vibrio agarivorans]